MMKWTSRFASRAEIRDDLKVWSSQMGCTDARPSSLVAFGMHWLRTVITIPSPDIWFYCYGGVGDLPREQGLHP